MTRDSSRLINRTRQPWSGPMVWDGRSVGQQSDWIEHFTPEDIVEVESAVRTAEHSGKSISCLTREDFKFSKLGQRLTRLRNDVLNGRGFALLRGLPADRWSDNELKLAYWAIGTWIGEPVTQNAKAHLLGHVIDQRATPAAGIRIYQTNQAQPFHSDSCDIVGLLCVRSAKHGGHSAIASSAAIHNALLSNQPQLLDTLYDEFLCDRYGEIPHGKDPYYPVHVFNDIEGKLVCCGMDPDIRSAQRLDGVDALTMEQSAALDAFQTEASKLALNMSLRRGDIQLVNNLTVVHAREAFEDYPERDRRRYMVRLWLSSSEGRQLPEFLAERWGNIEVGSLRGGIKVPGSIPAVYLDPDS